MFTFACLLYFLLCTTKVISAQDQNFTDSNEGSTDNPFIDEENQENTEMTLIGENENLPFQEFPGINSSIRSTLTSIDIERMEIDPNAFVNSLRGCDNLEYLSLDDVYWNTPFNTQLKLPKLKKFSLYQYNWNIKTSTATDFMSTLFFHTDKSNNVKININRAFLFEPEDSALEVSRLPYDISQHFQYSKLKMWDTVLNVTGLTNVIKLHLDSVTLIEGGIPEILQRCTQAEYLTLKLTTPYSIDLSTLPLKFLKELSMLNMFPWSSDPHPVKFEALEELELSSCNFNLSMTKFPPTLFRLLLQNVTLQEGNISSIVNEYTQLEDLTLANMSVVDIKWLDKSQIRGLRLHDSYLTQTQETELRNIKSVHLYQCAFDQLFIENFSETFNKIKRLTIKGDFNAYKLVKGIFNTSATAVIFHLEGSEKTLNDPEVKEGVKILEGYGISPGETQFSLYKWMNGSAGWDVFSSGSDTLKQNRKLRDALIYIYILTVSVIALIGIFGNIVSGLVLSRKRLRSSTSCILLGLTVSDLVLLVTYFVSVIYFGLKLILLFLGFHITDVEYPIFWFNISTDTAQQMENFQAQFLYAINKTAYTGSVYCTILVTLERYIAVCWPLSARRLLSIKRSVIATISVLIFSILLNGPRWLEGQVPVIVEREKNIRGSEGWIFYRETIGPTLLMYTNYRLIYHGWIWITLMYAVPVGLLVVLNYKIWKQLSISKRNRASMTSQNKKNDLEQAALTRMLLYIVTLFVVCNLVNGVVVWGFLWYGSWDRWEPSDIEVFSCIPLIINSSANFIIYCLKGQRFRRELVKMCPKCCQQRLGHGIGVSMHSESRQETGSTRV